ncbi:MerR family transcriptional regulator [Saccharopolyspora terrae]|uniref:MerR family transcriptional regulator n=1 Tax=Saccharopolyspora terrae TaxID=2530384 RepID=A0A4R4VH12_9PSEU|nr:MerR family transcriptional regulator [Saccharopolyspora terrae]TDD04211.1 MerR family transcriptional regulator [Saccharopolyspora terrae]
MAWSTRQVADLAGTTVKAVRHYHEIGLLDMPERSSNGYKKYGVSHLIRLVQIKRLSDLGLPLSQIAAMGNAGEDPTEAITVLDAELEATIQRLTRIRAELAVILRHRASPEVPPEFAPLSGDFSDSQKALLTVYSTVFSDEDLTEFSRALAVRDDVHDDLEALPEDADDEAVEELARRLAPLVRRIRAEHPRLANLAANSPHGEKLATNALAHAVVEFYNSAQIRALQRANALLEQEDDFS